MPQAHCSCEASATQGDAAVPSIPVSCGGNRTLRRSGIPFWSEQYLRRGEQRIRNTLVFATERLFRLLDFEPLRQDSTNGTENDREDPSGPAEGKSIGSPLDRTGPIPAELLKDPSTVDVLPWGFQEIELRRDLRRERLIWTSALAVSWAVTVVTILRLMNVV